MPETVLVTGGSGYIACLLVQRLLESDYIVHTTVRSLKATKKCKPLLELQKQYPDCLKIFEADLLKPGSFDEAMKGCTLVHHVASPFLLPEKIKDGDKQLLKPALEGTRIVLDSVNKTPTVKKVVLTSTIGAIFGDYSDVLGYKDATITEENWNETSNINRNPYHYSKVIAEKEAWRFYEAQGAEKRWNLVVICPGMVFGWSPADVSDSGSILLLDEMLKGYFFYGLANLNFDCVDIREVVQAHIAAAENPNTHGRYIVAQEEMTTFVEMSRILKKYHKYPFLLASWKIPDWMVRLVGPFFGLSPQYIRNHLGVRFKADNSKSVRELGITYRPIEETLAEHYRYWSSNR